MRRNLLLNEVGGGPYPSEMPDSANGGFWIQFSDSKIVYDRGPVEYRLMYEDDFIDDSPTYNNSRFQFTVNDGYSVAWSDGTITSCDGEPYSRNGYTISRKTDWNSYKLVPKTTIQIDKYDSSTKVTPSLLYMSFEIIITR